MTFGWNSWLPKEIEVLNSTAQPSGSRRNLHSSCARRGLPIHKCTQFAANSCRPLASRRNTHKRASRFSQSCRPVDDPRHNGGVQPQLLTSHHLQQQAKSVGLLKHTQNSGHDKGPLGKARSASIKPVRWERVPREASSQCLGDACQCFLLTSEDQLGVTKGLTSNTQETREMPRAQLQGRPMQPFGEMLEERAREWERGREGGDQNSGSVHTWEISAKKS